MGTLLESLKTLKMWQVGVLAAVMVAATGATLGGYALLNDTGTAGLGEDQQLIPVQYGDLVNQISTNGSLVYPNREALSFDAPGTVAEVLVEEGQLVEQGQDLAKLDLVTIASLERSVAQARVNLENAEDGLAESQSPHTPLESAEADSRVANAQLSLQSARNALDQLLNPTALVMAEAEEAVTGARLTLVNANDALDELLQSPTAQGIAEAETAVADTRLSLNSAQEALDELMAGAPEADIAQVQTEIDSAATNLASARLDLQLTQRDWENRVQASVDGFTAAEEDYRGFFSRWLGIDLVEEEQDLDPDTLLESWGVDLGALFDPTQRFQDLGQWIGTRGVPVDDPSTAWNEQVIYVWLNLYPGSIVVTCEDGAVPLQGVCIRDEIDAAVDSYREANDSLVTALAQEATGVATAEIAIDRALQNLTDAQDALDVLNAVADPLEIDSLQAQLAVAMAKLESAEDDLRTLIEGVDPLELEAKRQQVAVAQVNLDERVGDLAALLGEPDALEVEARRQQAVVAEATLNEAQEDLAELFAGVDTLEVALREADVASARLALKTAEDRLEGAILRSPITGVVTVVDIEAGQEVNPRTPVIEIADPTVVEVAGIVDEIDVLFVRVRAPATVIMDALPGGVLDGSVSAIGTAAQNQQGVVSYPIRIRVQVPEGVQLREGLSATARIVIREDSNVLLVPNQAIYGTFEQPLVRVKNNGQLEARLVALGNSDDIWTVVLDGLVEGDQVVIETAGATTDPFSAFRQLREGGGFGRESTGFGSGGSFGGGRGNPLGPRD